MMHVIHQLLNLVDSLGDLESGIVLIIAGIKSVRAVSLRIQVRKRTPPSDNG
jgi:hypothetical protein